MQIQFNQNSGDVLAKVSQVSDKAWNGKGQILAKTWLHMKQVERQDRNSRIWGYLRKCWVSIHLPWMSPFPQSNSLSNPIYPTYSEIRRTVTRSFLIISIFRTEILLIKLFEACFQQAQRMQADGWAWFCLVRPSKHSLKPLAIYFGLFSNHQ